MEFVALVQDNRVGCVVGMPTAGRPGAATVQSRLPLAGTGTHASIAMYVYERPDSTRRADSAVIPDVLVRQSNADIMLGRDAQLEWVLEHAADDCPPSFRPGY